MSLTSQAFADHGRIPAKYTCDGVGVSPPLEFHGVPGSAVALALVVDDPDAPGGTFNHWRVWNLSPSLSRLAEGERPAGDQGKNGFGNVGWGGPCPPNGEHRYVFTLCALDGRIDAPEAIEAHAIAAARLTGRYSRQ